jgi:hypothetical protein
MTLEEMKIKVYSMIEEYNEDADDLTDDEDLAAKFNSVCNIIMNELARIKKIPAYTEYEGTEGDLIDFTEIDSNFYQLNQIRDIDADIVGNQLLFNENGTAKIFYYKYPTQIDADTEDSYEFELSTDALECMPDGIAAGLLASDVSANYGQVYRTRYQEMKQQLDPRYSLGQVYIEGGIEI